MSSAPVGLSAQAIAGRGVDHPHDPADLKRCLDYCARVGLDTRGLRARMTGRSRQWDVLLDQWDELAALLAGEVANRTDGCAPQTYSRMRSLLAADGRA